MSNASKGVQNVGELMRLSRMWKFEGEDTLDDAKQMVVQMGNDLTKVPLPIQGRFLEPHVFIEDARIIDGELIVLELKILFEEDAKYPYVFHPSIEKRVKALKNSNLPRELAILEPQERMKYPLENYFDGSKARCGLTGL